MIMENKQKKRGAIVPITLLFAITLQRLSAATDWKQQVADNDPIELEIADGSANEQLSIATVFTSSELGTDVCSSGSKMDKVHYEWISDDPMVTPTEYCKDSDKNSIRILMEVLDTEPDSEEVAKIILQCKYQVQEKNYIPRYLDIKFSFTEKDSQTRLMVTPIFMAKLERTDSDDKEYTCFYHFTFERIDYEEDGYNISTWDEFKQKLTLMTITVPDPDQEKAMMDLFGKFSPFIRQHQGSMLICNILIAAGIALGVVFLLKEASDFSRLAIICLSVPLAIAAAMSYTFCAYIFYTKKDCYWCGLFNRCPLQRCC